MAKIEESYKKANVIHGIGCEICGVTHSKPYTSTFRFKVEVLFILIITSLITLYFASLWSIYHIVMR